MGFLIRLIIVKEEVNLKICKSDIKEEKNVLFIIKKEKKKRAHRFNVKRKILEGKVNLTFYSATNKKGAQLFFLMR